MTRFLCLLGVSALLNGCNCGSMEPMDGGVALDGSINTGREDAGAHDAGQSDSGVPDGGCSLGTSSNAASAGHLDLFGQISYFLDGGVVSPGHYRLKYVDGCMKYASSQDWAIHAYANGLGWYLVGETSATQYLMTPGTVGIFQGSGGYSVFADCVTANLAQPPVDFDFDGGVLGIWLNDNNYGDNLAGENGRNPSFELSNLGACVE